MSLAKFFNSRVDVPGLAAYLDGLDHGARVAATRTLTPAQQKALWAAVEGKTVDLDFFVPAGTPPLTEVIHYGYNSQIPGFRVFEKRFARVDGRAGELVGYNEFFLKGLVGPGYFVAHPDPYNSVVIDYYMVPQHKVASWPEIKPNDGLIPGLVYGRMHDHMRGVSRHVSIGRAVKNGKLTDNYFVLCRGE